MTGTVRLQLLKRLCHKTKQIEKSLANNSATPTSVVTPYYTHLKLLPILIYLKLCSKALLTVYNLPTKALSQAMKECQQN